VNSIPKINSIQRYFGDIGNLQIKHLPRHHNHPNMGVFANRLMFVLQYGHFDPPKTIPLPAGSRAASTLKKLPMLAPK
jgi:hypothetical protein